MSDKDNYVLLFTKETFRFCFLSVWFGIKSMQLVVSYHDNHVCMCWMCDNINVPLFTRETVLQGGLQHGTLQRPQPTATTHAATGISDSGNDVPLFDEKARAKHRANHIVE
jgi:hypothetical protein